MFINLSLCLQQGKYPHLIIKQAITLNGEVTVKFGEVPVGTTAERTLEIFNTTPVSHTRVYIL